MPITFDIPMREAPSSTSGICKMHHALITVPGPSRSNAEAREAHDTKWKPVMIDTLPPTATVKREVINNENSPYKSKPNTSIDIVKDLLSKEECERIIKSAEETGFITRGKITDITYGGTALSYQLKAVSMNSDNSIIYFHDDGLREMIWKRLLAAGIEGFEEPKQSQCTVAIGNCECLSGRYSPVGVNPLLRLLKYDANGAFTPHQDTVYRLKTFDNQKNGKRNDIGQFLSIHTVAIYLNSQGEAFSGGALKFIFQSNVTFDENTKPIIVHPEHNPPVHIPPRAGSAVLFDHREWHEGDVVTKGVKYMLQTDVVYKHQVCESN